MGKYSIIQVIMKRKSDLKKINEAQQVKACQAPETMKLGNEYKYFFTR